MWLIAVVTAALVWLYRAFTGRKRPTVFVPFPQPPRDAFLEAWTRAAKSQSQLPLTTYEESAQALRKVMKELAPVISAKDLLRRSGSKKLFVGHREGGALFEVSERTIWLLVFFSFSFFPLFLKRFAR